MVWFLAISAASVTTLRSRVLRPGRFHTSPSSVSYAYFSSAGATKRTLSRSFAGSACALAEAKSGNAAIIAVSEASRMAFMIVSPMSDCEAAGEYSSTERENRARKGHRAQPGGWCVHERIDKHQAILR